MRVRLSRFKWPHDADREQLSALPFVDVPLPEDGWYVYCLAQAMDLLDPNGEVVGYWDGNKYQSNRRIDISLRPVSLSMTHPTEAEYEKPARLWQVDDKGRLSVVDTYAPARGHWSIAGMRRSMESGYESHDWFDVVISEHQGGRGGGPPAYDFISFVWDHGIDLAFLTSNVGWLAARSWKISRRIWRSRKGDLKARLLVQSWQYAGLEDPRFIREWFDTKELWDPLEVARRLSVGTVLAIEFLAALGYEPVRGRGSWALGTSRRAQARRNKWMRSETTNELGFRNIA